MKASNLRRAGGFTLVELMVVIVIIVVLAGLSIGIARNVMMKSRLAASVGKVKDLGTRVALYHQDHGGLLPVWKFDSDNLYWWGVLVGDPKNESELEIFRSPGHKEFNVKRIESTISYGWNAAVVGRSESGSSGPGGDGQKRIVNFSDPGRVLVLADGKKINGYGLLDSPGSLPDPERYGGRAAALFLDGSGRELSIERDLRQDSTYFRDPESL